MDSLYQIYKYDFHKAAQHTIQAEADGTDGAKNVKIAQECFASLFDQNTIDKLAKTKQERRGDSHAAERRDGKGGRHLHLAREQQPDKGVVAEERKRQQGHRQVRAAGD